jgi:isoquinoline 1-oxidoreductase alpha subunit
MFYKGSYLFGSPNNTRFFVRVNLKVKNLEAQAQTCCLGFNVKQTLWPLVKTLVYSTSLALALIPKIINFPYNSIDLKSNHITHTIMAAYSINVNGETKKVDVASDTPLLWVLRDSLGLVGTKFGCGIAQCGACTVHLNGTAVRSCALPISAIGTSKVTTIEGLSKEGDHPVQQAWQEVDVPQCGYCQAGQIMSAAALLAKNAKPTEEQIATAMNGNICRCGTYHRIKEAVVLASSKMK